MVGGWRLWSAAVPCVGADVYIGPPTGLAVGWRLRVSARLRPQCRAGDFARRLGGAISQGLRDDASIVPYETQGKVLPGFAGYLRRKAAMHPSVCALRRIHRPVCGARIARRALKHACALRPSNLLRLAFSTAGGAQLRSPLQGRLWENCRLKGSPVRGAVGASRLRGAVHGLTNTLSGRREPSPAGVNARPTMQGIRAAQLGRQAW